MAKVGIIGGGAFGSAMACVIRRAGHDVLLWAREPEVVQAINADGINRIFLDKVKLVPGIGATTDLRAAVQHADIIVTAVPAQHLREVALGMLPFVPEGMPLVSCSKGVERNSLALMPELLREALPQARIAVLSGPSFAREIALDLPCGVDLAGGDVEFARGIARQISNPHFCISPCDDVIGVAIGGVMKNVIAIASGIAAGRGLGENARATLIMLGLAESTRLGLAKGGRADTFTRAAGVGDLMLTANSLQSRNTSLGVALGQGRSLADVLAERREVTEGAFSAGAVSALARRLRVNMPITFAVDEVLNHGARLDQAMDRLLVDLRAIQRPGGSDGRDAPA